MRRPDNEEKTLERIRAWRRACPDLAIRSSFIVGFPGETEADFELLLDWIAAAGIDRVGCFKYEPVAGAASNDLPDQVPAERKQERYERFMEAAQALSAERLAAKRGRRIDVLVDEVDGDGTAIARSQWDAPEIDGQVFVPGAIGAAPGDLLQVTVTGSDNYDLFAVPAVARGAEA
jgi:ribosomal protein S12 methylthiotransferase